MEIRPRERIRFGLILFGLAFCAIPSLIWLGVLSKTIERHEFERWDDVPCRIERSEVTQERLDRFKFKARYSYEVDGRRFESSAIGSEMDEALAFDSVRHRLPLLEEFKPGSAHVCRVKPGEPMTAALPVRIDESSSNPCPGIVPFALLAVFLMVGASMVSWAFPAIRKRAKEKAKSLAICVIGVLFGLPFAYVGITMSASGIRHRIEADDYIPTPAKVLYSGVESHNGGKSTVYSPVVGYEYTVDGTRYENDRYYFSREGTSNYELHRDEADKFHEGDEITVWRSPDDPRCSVIEPKMARPGFTLFCLAFMLIGIAVMAASIAHFVKSYAKENREDSAASFYDRPLRRSFAAVAALGVFALFWNLMSWSLVLSITNNFDPAYLPGEWPFLIFLVIGIGSAVFFIRLLVWELRGPHFKVAITCGHWEPGAGASARYETTGNGEVTSFRAVLRQAPCTGASRQRMMGHQQADTLSRQVFASSQAPLSGSFSFTIPDNFEMDADSWHLEILYRVKGRRREKVDAFAIPL